MRRARFFATDAGSIVISRIELAFDMTVAPVAVQSAALPSRRKRERIENGQIIEFTPSRPRRYYLDRQTDAGSVPLPPLGDKRLKRWTFGQKQGHLFRLGRGIEPFPVLFPNDFVPVLDWLLRLCRAFDFFGSSNCGIARHAVGHLPLQDRG